MILEILVAIMAGCICGIVTGITPGLHINLVAVILFSVSSILLKYTNIVAIGVFIIAMSIMHTFTDFISATFLGAPSDETAMAILPAHRLLFKGMGHEAVRLSVVGSFLGLVLAVALSPILIYIVPFIFNSLKNFIPYILSGVLIYMIYKEKENNKKFWCAIVIILSGTLGMVVFNIPNLKDPLLPMLSGLFGVSMLLLSLKENVELPKQRTTENIVVNKKSLAKSLVAGIFSGSIVSIFPGLGPAQASAIASEFAGKIEEYCYLILVGSIGTVSMVLSLITMFTIEKARNGSIAIVQQLLQVIDLNTFLLFISVALVAGGISAILSLLTSRIFCSIMNKINYSFLSIGIILFVSFLVFYFSGIVGLSILVISTSIGMIANIIDISRSCSMSCLILPIILLGLL